MFAVIAHLKERRGFRHAAIASVGRVGVAVGADALANMGWVVVAVSVIVMVLSSKGSGN